MSFRSMEAIFLHRTYSIGDVSLIPYFTYSAWALLSFMYHCQHFASITFKRHASLAIWLKVRKILRMIVAVQFDFDTIFIFTQMEYMCECVCLCDDSLLVYWMEN